jgi:hypothetical protein
MAVNFFQSKLLGFKTEAPQNKQTGAADSDGATPMQNSAMKTQSASKNTSLPSRTNSSNQGNLTKPSTSMQVTSKKSLLERLPLVLKMYILSFLQLKGIVSSLRINRSFSGLAASVFKMQLESKQTQGKAITNTEWSKHQQLAHPTRPVVVCSRLSRLANRFRTPHKTQEPAPDLQDPQPLNIHLLKITGSANLKTCKQIFEQNPDITHLDLSEYRFFNENLLNIIAQNGQKITGLHLNIHRGNISSDLLEKLITHCPNIAGLTIEMCNFHLLSENAKALLTKLPLEYLHLINCGGFDETTMHNLTKSVNELELTLIPDEEMSILSKVLQAQSSEKLCGCVA